MSGVSSPGTVTLQFPLFLLREPLPGRGEHLPARACLICPHLLTAAPASPAAYVLSPRSSSALELGSLLSQGFHEQSRGDSSHFPGCHSGDRAAVPIPTLTKSDRTETPVDRACFPLCKMQVKMVPGHAGIKSELHDILYIY